ncbi:hypothetical protein JAAARDRAFT_63133 [Jaapia argillacea MUCL 33604]|uniref:tRNA-splicing endonuclease subunit Sen54 N-terminal domain-containing protein n=1 Tax=Jaapia argillacea MUCL 33604 TaxID=933084 RepID=A0A067P9N2_9AGAM|nr:hypothetical protein JAAARDRAFT_63133 [Jaapia argillacea MUCL 33604]
MDDSLERPTPVPVKPTDSVDDEGDQSSGDEDEGPDWTKLSSALGLARPVIPKRGEKDYEPSAPGGGSGLQRHVLDRARNAMFDALRATKGTSIKNMSYGIWYPTIARAHVTIARGIHFSNMGHSVPRPVSIPQGEGKDVQKKVQKRLELLPEEALYLVERGAMMCWKEQEADTEDFLGGESLVGEEVVEGTPMSVQQAFAEMIGREELTLEKYQVYAYLKRLGYVVTRAKPPSAAYPIPAPYPTHVVTAKSSILQRISTIFSNLFGRVFRFISGPVNWWRPIHIRRWLHHNMDYPSLFKSLRIIPAGHSTPLHDHPSHINPQSPYQIFYHLYKPSTQFKKTSPPPPDFSVVVVNARATPMPSLYELTALYDILPELPPPLPRQRHPPPSTAKSNPQQPPPTSLSQTPHPSFLQRLFPKLFPPPPIETGPPPRRTNPFLALKAGKKNVVVAAVDGGNTSFYRFGQGAFEEWPMA